MGKDQAEKIITLEDHVKAARRKLGYLREEAEQQNLLELVRRYSEIIDILDMPS